ncbi:MAG: IS1 family transposase [Symploca sp. SIO2B6]|nr:IS1 family transposase [Symploca sp. SIO2B6]
MEALLYENHSTFRLNLFLHFTVSILNLVLDKDVSSSSLFYELSAEKYICPDYASLHTIKNGSTHNSKPKCLCKSCGRQFVINPEKRTISTETKALIYKLLLERISMRGIVRVTGVSLLTVIHAKLWAAILAIELANQLVNYGQLFQLFIVNMQLLILIFGTLTKKLFRINVTEQLGRKPDKQIILSG